MNNKDKALKLALEWVMAQPTAWMTDGFQEVTTAIKEALAQDEQNPNTYEDAPYVHNA